jgi:hypothetical protein
VFHALLQGVFGDKNHEYDGDVRADIELGGQNSAREVDKNAVL